MAEKFEVIIGAVDQASPVLEKFKGKLNEVDQQGQKTKTTLNDIAPQLTIAFAGATAAIAGATKVYTDFEESMRKVATQLTPEEYEQYFDGFTKGVQDMASEFGKSQDDIAMGLREILSASIAPAEAMDLLKTATTGARAGFADVNTVVHLLVSALKAYNLPLSEAPKLMDIFLKATLRGTAELEDFGSELGTVMGVAALLKIPIDEVSAHLATLTLKGFSAAEGATALTGAFMSFLDPSKQAVTAAENLGIQFDAATVQTNGFFNTLQNIVDAGPTPEEWSSLFPDRRSIKAVLGLVGDLDTTMNVWNDTLDSTGYTTEVFGTATDSLKFQLEQLKSISQILVSDFGESMAPVISDLAKIATEFGSVLRGLSEPIKDVIGYSALGGTGILGLLVGLVALNKIFSVIGISVGLSAGALMPWILAIEGIIIAIILLDKYKKPIIAFFEEVGKKIGIVNDEMTGFYGNTVDLGPRIEELTNQLNSATQELDKMDAEYKKLQESGMTWDNTMQNTYDAQKALVESLKKELAGLTGVQTEATQYIEKQDAATQNLANTTNELTNALNAVPSEIGPTPESVENTMLAIEGAVSSQEFLTNMENFGAKSIESWAAGFGDPNKALDAIKNSITDPLTEYLEPHSPPKALPELEEWGKKAGMAWGVALGLGMADKAVESFDAVQNILAQKLSAFIKGAVDIGQKVSAKITSNANAGGSVYNPNFNISSNIFSGGSTPATSGQIIDYLSQHGGFWSTSGGGIFDIPEYQHGGYVPETGLAYLHAGEIVIPPGEKANTTVGPINITINTNEKVDGRKIWEEIKYQARREGVAFN